MSSEETYETSSPQTPNHISKFPTSAVNRIPRSLGKIQRISQEPFNNSVGAGGDDCSPENFAKNRESYKLGGIIKQLVDQNRALIQMLEAQSELLLQITFSDNSEDPENPED